MRGMTNARLANYLEKLCKLIEKGHQTFILIGKKKEKEKNLSLKLFHSKIFTTPECIVKESWNLEGKCLKNPKP